MSIEMFFFGEGSGAIWTLPVFLGAPGAHGSRAAGIWHDETSTTQAARKISIFRSIDQQAGGRVEGDLDVLELRMKAQNNG